MDFALINIIDYGSGHQGSLPIYPPSISFSLGSEEHGDINLACFLNFCRSPIRSRSPQPSVSQTQILIYLFIYSILFFDLFVNITVLYVTMEFSTLSGEGNAQKDAVLARAPAEAEAGARVYLGIIFIPLSLIYRV